MAKYYRLNQNIQGSEFRVIGPDGKQVGVLPKTEALESAKQQGLDLVEISAQANPPVVKIVDFKKFQYDEKKKEKGAKKGGGAELKELWFSPRIASRDLEIRLKRADEFLKDGHKVKISVKFKGREMAHPEFGQAVLQKALDYFGDRIAIEREAKFEGRKLAMIITRAKGEKQNEQTENK